MKKKIVPGLYAAIDIGTKSIKAIQIEINEKGKRLLKTESIEIAPFDSFVNEIEYNQQINNAISKLAKDLNLSKCKKIISLFYNRELQVKLLDLPNTVKAEQLNQILPWEAKKLLSSHYKEEEFSYSYSIIRGNPISLVLAVIPQSLLNNHIKYFENTGIKPDSIYTDVFATLALQPIVDIAGLPALSIVNFGYSGTHLNIFSAGKLKFYRYIPTGTAEMTNPPQENELEMYSQKIRFSFDYFRAVSKLSQVDALFFMGGGSADSNVLSYEQNYFSPTKINSIDISSEIDISPVMAVSFNDSVNSENTQTLLPFVPVIGACLAEFCEDSDNMNLLTYFKNQEKDKKLAKLAKTIPLIFGLLAFFIGFGILFSLYTNKKTTIDNLNVELSSIKNEIETCNIKITNKKPKQKNQIKLSPSSMSLVQPLLENDKTTLSNLFYMVMRLRTPGMKISDILIRNKEEAEQILLKTDDETSFVGNSINEDTTTSPYLSKLSNLEIAEDQIKEDFYGKIVIIYGTALNAEQVSKFSENLNSSIKDKNNHIINKTIKRITSINIRKIKNGNVEFLLKGEIR